MVDAVELVALWSQRALAAEAELENGHKALTAAGAPKNDEYSRLSITGRVVRLKERAEKAERERDRAAADRDLWYQDWQDYVARNGRQILRADRYRRRALALVEQVRRYREHSWNWHRWARASINLHRQGLKQATAARDVWALRACEEQQRAGTVDNPALEGTGAVHSAWWRGHDAGVIGVADRIRAALDGSDAGAGVLGHEKLEWLRRGVLAMRAELEHERVRYQSLDAHCTAHERSLMHRAEAAERRALALATALGRSLKLVQAYAWMGRKQDVVACPWCHEAPTRHATDCEVAAVLADLTGQAALAEHTELKRRLAEASEVLAELEWGVADWEDIPGGTIETFSTCPSCTHRQREGHAPDCRLAAWLRGKA